MHNSLIINGKCYIFHSPARAAKFRRILPPFVLDLTAVQITAQAGLIRVSINRHHFTVESAVSKMSLTLPDSLAILPAKEDCR